jgi:hypothetical protein
MTPEEVHIAQSRPTDFSALDASLMSDAALSDSRYAMDEKLFVRFYKAARHDAAASEAANRPIFKDTVCIKIAVPGDKLSVIDREATQDDIKRFPKHYDKFSQGLEQTIGTPLMQAGFLPETLVEELKFFKILTVEQLANAPDSAGSQFVGFQDMKTKARAYLERANGASALAERLTKVEEEAQKKDREIEELRKLLKARKGQAEG